MMENMKKMFETMTKEDSDQMAQMMENMPMMKNMCKSMFESSQNTQSSCGSDCGCNSTNNDGDKSISSELKPLFDEWINQIKEEVEMYKKENPNVALKEIADHFKLSEQSMAYIVEGSADGQEIKTVDDNYINLKIRKTNNSCSLCEDYVHKNESKPVVVLSCEGACLRGEISRRAANILCHSILPENTVRLCLGSALTKEGGQRSLVKNANKLIALEGCPVSCGSRMVCGISNDLHPQVIRTDALAEFDKSLFGADEMSEEEINKQAFIVAKKIAELL